MKPDRNKNGRRTPLLAVGTDMALPTGTDQLAFSLFCDHPGDAVTEHNRVRHDIRKQHDHQGSSRFSGRCTRLLRSGRGAMRRCGYAAGASSLENVDFRLNVPYGAPARSYAGPVTLTTAT